MLFLRKDAQGALEVAETQAPVAQRALVARTPDAEHRRWSPGRATACGVAHLSWAQDGHESASNQEPTTNGGGLRRASDMQERSRSIRTGHGRHMGRLTHNPWVVGSSPTRP